MDILSTILHVSGLQRRLLDLQTLTPGTALRFPCERSFGLHAVTRGQAYVHAPDLAAPIALKAGDLVLMARGCVHLLSLASEPPTRFATVPIAPVAGAAPGASIGAASDVAGAAAARRPPGAATVDVAAGDEGVTQVISAAYQLWHAPLHPFLRNLPPWFVVRGATLPQLSPVPLTLGLLDRELGDAGLGATSATHGLLDALFAFTLREIARRANPDAPGWSHAVADRPIHQLLTLMHNDLAHGWTLEELGQHVGLSRSALAERFRNVLDDTPLNHLRTLRMQKAMQLLSETRQTLEQVAQAVGYQDAFGFSKVFKRTTGQSPRRFREADAASRQSAYRFREA